MFYLDRQMRLAVWSLCTNALKVIVVVITTSSFMGELLMLSAGWSATGYYDRAAVATDSKECSKIGTCVLQAT